MASGNEDGHDMDRERRSIVAVVMDMLQHYLWHLNNQPRLWLNTCKSMMERWARSVVVAGQEHSAVQGWAVIEGSMHA